MQVKQGKGHTDLLFPLHNAQFQTDIWMNTILDFYKSLGVTNCCQKSKSIWMEFIIIAYEISALWTPLHGFISVDRKSWEFLN